MQHFIDQATGQIYAYEIGDTQLPVPPEDAQPLPLRARPVPPAAPADPPALADDATPEEAAAFAASQAAAQARWLKDTTAYALALSQWDKDSAVWSAAELARQARNSQRVVLAHLQPISDEDLAALRAAQRAAALAVAPVPQVVSRFQARAALYLAGELEATEAYMAHADTPMLVKLAWMDAQEFERSSPTVEAVRVAKGWTHAQVDALFVTASGIKA